MLPNDDASIHFECVKLCMKLQPNPRDHVHAISSFFIFFLLIILKQVVCKSQKLNYINKSISVNHQYLICPEQIRWGEQCGHGQRALVMAWILSPLFSTRAAWLTENPPFNHVTHFVNRIIFKNCFWHSFSLSYSGSVWLDVGFHWLIGFFTYVYLTPLGSDWEPQNGNVARDLHLQTNCILWMW